MDKKSILSNIKDIANYVMGLDTADAEKVDTPQVELTEEAEAPIIEDTVQEAAEVEVAAEEVVAEVEAPAVEYATKDELNDLRTMIEEAKSLFSKQVAEKDAIITEKEAKAVELQKQLDEKPDAEAIVATPKVELTKEIAPTKKGRITQFLKNKN